MIWLIALLLAFAPPAPQGLHLTCGSAFDATTNDPDGYIMNIGVAPDQRFSWLAWAPQTVTIHAEATNAQSKVIGAANLAGGTLYPEPVDTALVTFTSAQPFRVYVCDPIYFSYLPLSRSP